MTKKIFFGFGILVSFLVFGMSVMGCASLFYPYNYNNSTNVGTRKIVDHTPDYIKKTSLVIPDVMERWGAKYKDLQGKIIDVSADSERNDINNLILQRTAIIAFEAGYKAFTIMSKKDNSYTYDKYLGSVRVKGDTTTVRDAKGNIVGTTTSDPHLQSYTTKVTQFKMTYTIQLLTNENDESLSNIYSVSKYLPKYIKITGLNDKDGEIVLSLSSATDTDTYIFFFGTAKNGVAYCTGEKWPENGQYFVTTFRNFDLSTEEFKETYFYTDGNSFEQLGLKDDMSAEEVLAKLPKINVTNVSMSLDFKKFQLDE